MKPYRYSGKSTTIVSYEIHRDAIDLKMVDGTIQTFTIESAGKNNIERMKALAAVGDGLGTYLSGSIKVAPARVVA